MRATTPFMPASSPGKEIAVGYGRWPREGSRVRLPDRDARALAPSFAIASNVEDMTRFAMWQFRVLDGEENDVLSPATLREMQTLQWSEPDWGLGFSVWRMGDQRFVGHQGGCSGFKSQFILNPEEKIAVVVMVNAKDAPQFTLAFRTYEIMAPSLIAPAGDTEKEYGWERYTGYYTADESWSEAEVLEWGGSLALMWVPTPNPLGSLVKLRRVEGDVFRQVKDDGEPGKHYVFKADAAGNIVGMRFNNNLLKRAVR
jgi:CubicO group peptidase (beta-lactamase class C family)